MDCDCRGFYDEGFWVKKLQATQFGFERLA